MKPLQTFTLLLIVLSQAQSALAHNMGGTRSYKFDDAPSHDEEDAKRAEQEARDKQSWDQFMKLVDQQTQDTSQPENSHDHGHSDNAP